VVIDAFVPTLPVAAETILDEIRVFLAVLAPDGTILWVNGEVLRRTGGAAQETLGRPFATARWWTHTPGVSEQVEAALQQARAGRHARLQIEAEINTTQRIIVDIEVRPARDPSGAVVALVAEGRDISEQRAIERKLREAQFRWRTIADFTVDWEFWLHPSGHFLWVSPSCQRLSGYGPDDFMQGRVSLGAIAHEQDRKRVSELLMQAFSRSTGHSQSWRLVRRDGAVRWVSMSWQPVASDDGAFMGVRGNLRDVTEQMTVQLQLERSVEAYRTLARHFPRGLVALLDRDLRFVVCDGPAFEGLAMQPGDVVGKRVHEVIDADTRSRVEPLIASATAGAEIADIVRFGSSAWLVHLTPIRDEQDRVAHIIASAVESQDPWPEAAEPPTGPGRHV
jgi:PAS domain S-box-containing protein